MRTFYQTVTFGHNHFWELCAMKSILIYDTTLRDGSQGEKINFSAEDKLRIAQKLDAVGVHYIEGGWPGSNPRDVHFFELAKKASFKHGRLAAFGSPENRIPVRQKMKTLSHCSRRKLLL